MEKRFAPPLGAKTKAAPQSVAFVISELLRAEVCKGTVTEGVNIAGSIV
jgi:hypothetical protein